MLKNLFWSAKISFMTFSYKYILFEDEERTLTKTLEDLEQATLELFRAEKKSVAKPNNPLHYG